jgi:hypothetical protein
MVRQLRSADFGFCGRKSWLGESEQADKWIFCLTAAMIAAHQERS